MRSSVLGETRISTDVAWASMALSTSSFTSCSGGRDGELGAQQPDALLGQGGYGHADSGVGVTTTNGCTTCTCTWAEHSVGEVLCTFGGAEVEARRRGRELSALHRTREEGTTRASLVPSSLINSAPWTLPVPTRYVVCNRDSIAPLILPP